MPIELSLQEDNGEGGSHYDYHATHHLVNTRWDQGQGDVHEGGTHDIEAGWDGQKKRVDVCFELDNAGCFCPWGLWCDLASVRLSPHV